MAGLEDKAKNFEMKAALITIVASSLGFVSALFWRDAIKDLIAQVVPAGEGLTYQFIVAIGVTVFAVLVIFLLNRYVASFSFAEKIKKAKKHVDKLDNKIIGKDLTIRKKKPAAKKRNRKSKK